MTESIAHETPAARKRSLSRGAAIIFGLILAFLAITGWRLVRVNSGPVDEGLAPDFTLTSFSGETIRLSDLRGQVVIINFWASWCDPCRDEAAYLENTWRKYQDQGVVFIGVDYLDTEPKALAYIEEFDISYFNGPDLRTQISDAYNIQGVPETFYISRNGEISGVKIGPLVPPELDQTIEELLAKPYP